MFMLFIQYHCWKALVAVAACTLNLLPIHDLKYHDGQC